MQLRTSSHETDESGAVLQVTAYTDGSCDPNPGPGGWGAVIRFADREIELNGNAPQATNNQMEMEAAVAVLAYLQGRYGSCQVTLHTDSQYLRRGINEWIAAWAARDWQTKAGEPVKNQALWRRLHELAQVHHVTWQWVKGHAGNPDNEHVDRLAAQARARLASGPSTQAAPQPQPTPETSVTLSLGVSCLGSKGPGGWAAVLRTPDGVRVLRGQATGTTSNALYLQAAAAGLRVFDGPTAVSVYAASDYLIQGASRWVASWQRRGWRTQGGSAVKNRADWEALIEAAAPHQVTWLLAQDPDQTPDLVTARQAAAQEASHAAGA